MIGDNLDPRLRLLAVVSFAVTVVALESAAALAGALAIGVAAVLAGRLPRRAVLANLLHLEAVLLVVVVSLPLTTPGPALAAPFGLAVSGPGLMLAGAVVAKSTAIALVLMAVLAPLDAPEFARGLAGLGAPERLVELMQLATRYVGLIGREAERLRTAMTARGFRPRTNLHTLHSYGYLAGMLLVLGFERAERVLMAMKCRGFHSRLGLVAAAGPVSVRERRLAAGWIALLIGLIALEAGLSA